MSVPAQDSVNSVLGELEKDHANVSRLLAILESQMAELESVGQVSFQLATDVMYYMTQYPDLFHHPREELLFRRLDGRDASVTRLIDELRQEHRVLNESGRDLYRLFARIKGSKGGSHALLSAKTSAYANMLRDHMRKEESGVFRPARFILGNADWDSLNSEFSIAPDPLFGGSVEQGFLSLRRYLLKNP